MASDAGTRPRGGAWPFAPAVIGVQLRRLRAEWSLATTVFGIVLLSTFVFAGVPRLFNEMSDDGLAHAVRSAQPITRNIEAYRAAVLPAQAGDADPYSGVRQAGADFLADLPPELQAIVFDQSFMVDLPQHIVVDQPGVPPYPLPRYLTLRYQDEINQHLDLVEGRMPARTDERVPVAPETPGAQRSPEAQLFEIAISRETASQLGLTLGDRLVLTPFGTDVLVKRLPQSQHRLIAVEVVGFIELRDLREDYWMNFPALNRATEYDDGQRTHIFATALMARDAYSQTFGATGLMLHYRWHYFVDPDSFDAGQLDALSTELRKLETEYSSSSIAGPERITARTGLLGIFNRFISQRRTSEAILALTTVGLAAVALAVIALLAALIAERRREATALVRGRGGGPRQILAAQAVEGALISAGAALVGLGVATLIVPGRASRWSLLAAAGMVVTTTTLLYLAARPIARRHLGQLERREAAIARLSPRRLVLEGLIVVLAGAGVYLLRRRGLTGDSSTTDLAAFDPYLAAVPVLLGLATGIVALRLYPVPVRVLAWIAALRRDLVPVLGFRRVARQPGATNLPLLVLLLSVAVAVFSSIMLTTIADGQVRTSWQNVGADYRVSTTGTGFLRRDLDLSDVDGVSAVAAAYHDPKAIFATATAAFGAVDLFAVDVAALERVNGGTPAAPDFPPELAEEVRGDDVGRPGNPIPALLSSSVGNRSLQRGDTFTLNLLSEELTFIVIGTRDRFPGLGDDRSFVIAPFDALAAGIPDFELRPTDLFLRAPERSREELVRVLDERSPAARLESRAAEYRKVHDSPLINGVERGFQIGLVATGVYSALAILVALVLTGHERVRDLAYLRTMGLSQQQALQLTVVEHAPEVVLALGAGIALGIGVARIIEPGLDLTAFTGPGIPVALRIDWLTVVLIAFGVVAVVAGAVAATTVVARRASLGQALRVGDE